MRPVSTAFVLLCLLAVDADTHLRYAWTREGARETLRFASLRIQARTDGVPTMDTAMSRAECSNLADGQTETVAYDDAPEELKATLRDCFDAPLVVREVDANGVETKRETVAGPGAKLLVDNGVVANAIFFHPPFYADRDAWEADATLSMGNGGFVTGRLAYKKKSLADGRETLTVSGTLVNDSFTQPGTPLTIQKSRYVVAGEETYDLNQRDWIAGRLTLTVSFGMTAEGKSLGDATGTMTMEFKKE